MITGVNGNQVKHVIALLKKAKERRESGEFVVEGPRMVFEAPKDRIVKIYYSESFKNSHKEEIEKLLHGELKEKTEKVEDKAFATMSDTQTPQGIMAVVKQSLSTLEDILANADSAREKKLSKGVPGGVIAGGAAPVAEAPLYVVTENLQDPGNLGTIIRMGEGSGVNAVIMSKDTVDVFNPKVVRSTMGSIYRMKMCVVSDVISAIEEIKAHQVKVYAAHLKGKNSYEKENYKTGTAFLIGNEGNGLTDAVADAASEYIRIPMKGQVESLNAAIACTVLCYEAMRQRG